MLRLADRRRGLTLLEVLFASGMTVFILGSVVFISLASAKATLIVIEQGQRQSQAALALDRMAEILRNAEYPVNIVSATEVRFTDARNPSDTGRIYFANGEIFHDPDLDTSGDERSIAKYVEGLVVEPNPDPLVGDSALQLSVSYNYQTYLDRFPDETGNAVFVTTVFMRNVS